MQDFSTTEETEMQPVDVLSLLSVSQLSYLFIFIYCKELAFAMVGVRLASLESSAGHKEGQARNTWVGVEFLCGNY